MGGWTSTHLALEVKGHYPAIRMDRVKTPRLAITEYCDRDQRDWTVKDTERRQARQSAKEVDSGRSHEAENGHRRDVQEATGTHTWSISRFCWRTHRLGVRGSKGGTTEVLWVPGHRGLQVLVGHLINNVVAKENRAGQMERDEDIGQTKAGG